MKTKAITETSLRTIFIIGKVNPQKIAIVKRIISGLYPFIV
jgi:hypothetical protein